MSKYASLKFLEDYPDKGYKWVTKEELERQKNIRQEMDKLYHCPFCEREKNGHLSKSV